VPTFVVDKNHRVVQWNRACQEITGIAPEEILGRPVWEGFSLDERGSLADRLLESPESLRADFKDAIVSMTESGSYALETFLPNFRGGMRAVVGTAPILDEDGTVRGAIQTIQDIGWSVKSPGTRLAGSGWENDGSFPYPVVQIDPKGKVVQWNKAAQEFLGYEEAEIVGKSPLVLVAKPYRESFRDVVIRVLKGESVQPVEWRYHRKDGSPVYVLARAFPVGSPPGGIEGCIITHTDITELRLRMRVLERAGAESKEKLKSLMAEYNLLKKNIATFLRKKGEEEEGQAEG
jgi:PAS domain S-box-containing protein